MLSVFAIDWGLDSPSNPQTKRLQASRRSAAMTDLANCPPPTRSNRRLNLYSPEQKQHDEDNQNEANGPTSTISMIPWSAHIRAANAAE